MRRTVLAVVVCAVLGLAAAPSSLAAIFTVTTNASGGTCPLNCSLRGAIEAANASPGADVITFNLPLAAFTISPESALPAITEQVTIDGTTQPGYVAAPHTPAVVVDGGSLGASADGLVFADAADGSVVKALSLTRFGGDAIELASSNTTVDLNWIGVRPDGSTVGSNGVGIRVGGDSNTIGNSASGGNLVVASAGAGVSVDGSNASILSNVISSVPFVAASGNAIGIDIVGATETEIDGNVIKDARTGDGVVIRAGSAGVDILDNGIVDNAGLGIDTRDDGVTENNPPGPVDHENFPTVVSATPGGGALQVVVEFTARGGGGANQSYRLQLFANATCDPSGNGEGALPLQSFDATTNAGGFATHTFAVPAATTGALTATATPLAAANNRSTSEYSDCLTVSGGGSPSNVTTSVVVAPGSIIAGGLATATVTVTNSSSGAVDFTQLTATLPPGFSLVRNSTRVNGVATIEPTASEPAALGGTLVWPRLGGNPPPEWPVQIAAGASKTISFELAAPAAPVGPAALTVGGTSPGHTVVAASTNVAALAAVADRLVIPASEDTWVDQANPGASHGSEATFDVQGGNGLPDSRRRGLLKFDLSAIPAGATVTGARLRVGTVGGFSYDGDINHHAVAIPDTWSESTVTWLTRPADGIGTVPCADAPTGCDAGLLAETNPNYFGRDPVFYGGLYGVFDHLHTFPPPGQTGALLSRLAQRIQTERGLPGATVSIEILNPCCGPPNEGYLANYVSSENARADLRPALVLTLGPGGPPPTGDVTLDAVQASVQSTGVVPLAQVPGSAFVARPPGATQATPIKEIPIKEIPIKEIPITEIPITEIPITEIGFSSAQVIPLLRAFPLSELPLLRTGGWPTALQGTPFATAPLQNVSLGDALAVPQIAGLGITLTDLDLSRSRLGSLPAVAVALGDATLGSLPLPGNANWCALASVPSCSASSTVLSIAIQGAPITEIPITEIPITEIPITEIPITEIPITEIPITEIPITEIPITEIPITEIPITEIGALINCAVRPCTNPNVTLLDAFVGDWFLPTATLGQLLEILPADSGVTFADVMILLFSSTASVGWEDIDLERAGLQAAAGGANAVDWNADVELTAPALDATVTLPRGFVYDRSTPATVRVLPAGAPVPLPAPLIGAEPDGDVTLEWALSGVLGTTLRISFQTFPALRVGPQSGTVETAPTNVSDPAPISVTETFEPNGEGSPEPVNQNSLYLSYVTTADDLDFYSLPAPPIGSTIRVYLSHLPADYDLAVYAPTDAQARPELAGTEQLDSPPLGDEGVPIDTRRAALPPETLDDLRLDAGRPLVGVSANRATEDDSVVAISGGGSGNYLIQVTPYNGATSAEPYMLRVEIEPPRVPLTSAALAAASGATGGIPALPAGTNTLFLWNRSQLNTLYGAAAATSVLNAMTATQAELTSLGFPSAIVGVDANAGVAAAMAAWNADPGSPVKANAVVRAINAVVDGLRAQPNGSGIKYLVLVGGDRAMPFARLEDYTTIANESGYAQSLGAGNELTAALGAGTMLSDDAYADTSPVQYLNRQLFVPNLAVGRLVETPPQIVGALTRYRDFDGRLDPTTGGVAGYDFLRDGSEAVRDELDARPGVGFPAGKTQINDTWSRQSLLELLFTAPPSLASLNGHADHFRLQPPSAATASTRPAPFTTSDLTAAGTPALTNRLVFSMGCHSGLSVADALVTQQGLDWPQAYAGKGATYLGNTTFGYGDSNVVAYTEELNRLLAGQVRAGGPIGDALRLAKQEYFSTRGVFGVYDEKAMAAFTLYGLPMWSIGSVPQPQSTETGGVQPLERAAAAAPLAIPSTTTGVDPVTGLAIESFDATSPSFTAVTPPGGAGTYLRGDSGVQVSHLRPIQPKLVLELTGNQGHGALVTGLTSSDDGGVNPVYARPIVDQAGDEPELAFDDVAYPSKLLTLRTYLVAAGERQRLVVGTGQFFGNPAVADVNGTGVQRRYTRIAGHVHRSTSTDRLAPTFTKIDAFVVTGNAAFTVETAGGDVRRVLVGYRSGTASVWQFVDLAQGAGGRWSGGGPVAADRFEYFVQAVDEAGNVGVSTNKGFYHDGVELPPDPTPNGPLELEPPAPSGDNGWYTGSVVVSVDGPEGVPVQVSVDGGPFVAPGTDGSVTVTGDGIHVVEARAATGATDRIVVPIDTTAPQVVFETPSAGASYEPGSTQRAAYACVDPGAGVVACTGQVAVGSPISTQPPGQKTFTVQVRDRAGNTATRSVTYNVAYRKIVFASFRSGNGDIYAVGRDGSGLVQLTNTGAIDTEPAWSPDGKKIAFASRRNGLDLDIFVMDANGSNVVQLTTTSGDDSAPAWSPDGTRIAFQSFRDRNFELYAMNANGSSQTRLTSDSRIDTNPTWSPDGAKLAWTRGLGSSTEIYSMNANGSGIVRLTSDGRDPNWGSNGKLVFTRSLVGAFVWEVFTMSATGGQVTRLTTVNGPDYDPAWSRDAQQIVFASGRDGGVNLELYVMEPNGANQRRVTTNAAVDRTPDW